MILRNVRYSWCDPGLAGWFRFPLQFQSASMASQTGAKSERGPLTAGAGRAAGVRCRVYGRCVGAMMRMEVAHGGARWAAG
jgi:hypothetical protein